MLKGTTKIELTDVNTGAVETYENHNMVTNALRDVLKPLGLCKRPSRFLSEFTPYYEHLLGGILCFDSEIPENADNYYLIKMVDLLLMVAKMQCRKIHIY